VSACKEDDPSSGQNPIEKTVVDIAVENGFNKLAEALTEANLVDALNGTGPFTVFAPTDAAFDALYSALQVSGPAEIDDATLTSVLQYHVYIGNVTSDQLVSGDLTMLNGKVADIDASVPSINDANIIAPIDLEASNGVVHTIDAVIVPEKNIVEIAGESENLTILVEALTLYPDLVDLLSDESGEFTVFAPTDAAFQALLPVIKQESLATIPEAVLRNILEYHVIAGAEVLSGDLSVTDVAAANGELISITDDGNGSFLIAGQAINTADVEASNGVIHVMDGVLVPPSALPFVGNALTFAYFNKDFTTLVAAVSASEPSLIPALQGANITLFAPTNDAFAAAGITEIPAEPTLSAVLTYHVLGAIVKAGDIPTTNPAAPYAAPSLGGNIYISNQGGDAGVFINGTTEVTAFDLTADNGAVVHVINRTLLPPDTKCC
jgi:transforming growth factor-beta-induced protein